MSSRSLSSLSAAEACCIEYARTRDPRLRDRIIDEYQWLADICARRMNRRGETLEDLRQIANIGLLQALDRFEPALGGTYRSYASATIEGLLQRHYRSNWRVHVPRRMQQLNLDVSRTRDHLTIKLQRSPTVEDIARHLGIAVDDVLAAAEAGESYWPTATISGTIAGGRSVERHRNAIENDPSDHVEQRHTLFTMLATLPERTREVLYLRYFEELTQSEVGQRLGLGQVHVSRLERGGLQKLRQRHEARLAHADG